MHTQIKTLISTAQPALFRLNQFLVFFFVSGFVSYRFTCTLQIFFLSYFQHFKCSTKHIVFTFTINSVYCLYTDAMANCSFSLSKCPAIGYARQEIIECRSVVQPPDNQQMPKDELRSNKWLKCEIGMWIKKFIHFVHGHERENILFWNTQVYTIYLYIGMHIVFVSEFNPICFAFAQRRHFVRQTPNLDDFIFRSCTMSRYNVRYASRLCRFCTRCSSTDWRPIT